MKRMQDRMSPESLARVARFAAFAMMLIFGVGALGFSALAYIAHSRATAEETRAKALAAEIEDIKGTLDETRQRAAVGVENQSRAVAEFQRSVAKLAQNKDCRLAEFLASTDVQPFLTRFEQKGESGGWNQIEAQITITGSAQAICEMIEQLPEGTVPIEFSSVLISREKIEESGSEVKAKIQLRILVQGAGGSA